MSKLPWIIEGDFNEVLWSEEKKEGSSRDRQNTQAFREVLKACELEDMGLRGSRFTWSNRRKGESCVEERLDRFLSTEAWRRNFRGAVVHCLDFWRSDHRPILLDCNGPAKERADPRKYRFYYENCWAEDREYSEIIQRAWNEGRGNTMKSFLDRLHTCAEELRVCNKRKKKEMTEEFDRARKELQLLNNRNMSQSSAQIQRVERRLSELQLKVEVYWK